MMRHVLRLRPSIVHSPCLTSLAVTWMSRPSRKLKLNAAVLLLMLPISTGFFTPSLPHSFTPSLIGVLSILSSGRSPATTSSAAFGVM